MTTPAILSVPVKIVLDGFSLTVVDLVAIARGPAQIAVPHLAMNNVDRVHERLLLARESGTVYGANTGVGANRHVGVGDGRATRAAHAMGLLRSCCAGVGTVEEAVTARATMAVRLNQFLAGGSGISGPIARGLMAAITSGSVPTLHRLGAIGTADLSPLAELALTLVGDRPWLSGGIAPVPLADSDALPFISSSALTVATAALAAEDLDSLLQSASVVAALSFLALDGSAEAYDDLVHRARPLPHQRAIAGTLRHLVGANTEAPRPSARLQDPFGLRMVPQVHAPAVGAIGHLMEILDIEINAASENPLVTDQGVRHHGQSHQAALALALDSAKISIFPMLTLSAARLGLLLDPEMTGLAPFLSDDLPGSSGLMITEYVVQDVLSELRNILAPVGSASVSISLGTEEHASFAAQAARQLHVATASAPVILAIEAIAAVRALQLAPERLGSAPARRAYDYLASELEADVADRSLGDDIGRATRLLPGLAQFAVPEYLETHTGPGFKA